MERYEHVIDGVYLDGMQNMFTYQKTVLNSVKGITRASLLTTGYRIEKGEPASLMGPLYSDIKTKKKFRGRFLKSLVNLLDQDSQSNTSTAPAEVDFGRFIVENLLYLEFGVIEEVFYVIHTIDRILASTGVSLLQTIEGGEMTESVAVLAQRSIVMSLLVGLKQHLKVAYSLTEAKCRAFDPKKAGAAKDNKSAVRARGMGVIEWSEIPYVDKEIQEDWQAEEQLRAVCPLSQLR